MKLKKTLLMILVIILLVICMALGIMGIMARGENAVLENAQKQLEDDNSAAQSEKEALESQIEELLGTIEAQQKEIDQLKSQIEEMTKIDLSEYEAGTVLEDVDTSKVDDLFQSYTIEKGDAVFNRIYGKSYRDNSNIGLDDLRYLKLVHYNFDHQIQVGELIVNVDVSEDVINIFKELFAIEYEVESMHLIDNYWTGDGETSDSASIDVNNTSAFCYRAITGGGNLSNHAYGRAIDINPQQNPYVYYSGGTWRWSHENATPYIDRTSGDPHVIVKGDACYEIFEKYGFSWGGDWSNPLDYQHFEKES